MLCFTEQEGGLPDKVNFKVGSEHWQAGSKGVGAGGGVGTKEISEEELLRQWGGGEACLLCWRKSRRPPWLEHGDG